MERTNLGGRTFFEERDVSVTLDRRQRGRFGHLREVGLEWFVSAVEEDQTVWVVVHIYDPVRACTFMFRWSPATHRSLFACFPLPSTSHSIDARSEERRVGKEC